MPNINFDFSLNIQTVIAIILFVASIVGFGWNIRTNQKVTAAQYTDIKAELEDVKGQLGELRRLHLQIAEQSQQHDIAIKEVVKTAEINKKQINENTKTIKVDLPKVLATVEALKKG